MLNFFFIFTFFIKRVDIFCVALDFGTSKIVNSEAEGRKVQGHGGKKQALISACQKRSPTPYRAGSDANHNLKICKKTKIGAWFRSEKEWLSESGRRA